MTLAEILEGVYADLNFQTSPSAPDAKVITRLKRYVNEGIRTVIGEPGMTRLLDSDTPATFATVANQSRYTLPESVAFIRGIQEHTNNRTLRSMPLDEYRRIDSNPANNTGLSTHYVPMGSVAVAVQPTAACEIFVKSDVAETPVAYIEGVITGGYTRTASATMTGVTAKSLSTTITNFIEITDFYISANAVGNITLHSVSGAGTELARITIGAKRPRYTGFYLWPTPSAAVTYYVDYRRELAELVNDTDVPPGPTDFHYLLEAYARMREYEKSNDDRFPAAAARYTKALSRLKYATQTGPDELPVIGRGRTTGRSRLGAWTPADSYWRGW
jgi:hypothetical protein